MKALEALRRCHVPNPFSAPVYHTETASSTMDISRGLLSRGEPHGTVIAADYQENGRGRIPGRLWQTEDKMSLPFTILLRYLKTENIPPALTLRAGLALSLAIEEFSQCLRGHVKIKWPNDIMINNKKAAGILCESDGVNVHAGIGINIRQKEFPDHLRERATSIALAARVEIPESERFLLLEKALFHLHNELQEKNAFNWISRIEDRLYKKGEDIVFIDGAPDSGRVIKGTLRGISANGEILIASCGAKEKVESFVTGELVFG